MHKNLNSHQVSIEKQRQTLCDSLNFAGSEAYKQLRTNIFFSLPKEDKECRMIAITSAAPGDGKSTTSINLAYSMAQANKKVLLIEGDMRLPYMAKRLELEEGTGLSDYLVGSAAIEDIVRKVDVKMPFDAIIVGSIPPNPSELLTSNRMKELLDDLGHDYDYILLDLPPVNVVTDAAGLSNWVDGYIVVVRQDKTCMHDVDNAMEKLGIVDAKVLGFVINDVRSHEHGYKSYSNNYYYG